MGTSSIGFIVLGQTGPTGPIGETGPRGATGTGTGKTGSTGSTGSYITVVDSYSDPLFLGTSDSISYQISQVKGPTGYTGTIFGSNAGIGLSLYSSASGYTLTVRGLTFIGNLQGQVTGNSILITPLDVSYGVTLASTVKDSTLIYAKTDNILDSTRISYGKTYGDLSFSNITGITANSTYLHTKTNITEIFGGNNVILGITNSGIYKIHTPIGLSGFSLNSSNYNENELISVTLFIEGNGFSQFPSNVYFGDSAYSSHFGCGTNILNLMSPDKGTNWYATIIERGYGVTKCNQIDGIGSCCYSEGVTSTCKEYVTQEWCNEKSGTFNLFTPCDSACGATAICCSNGNCVSGVSESECIYFGGKYYIGITCDKIDYGDQSNTIRQCYRSDLESTVCCTGGQCIPDVTYKICQDYYHGVPFTGACCELNCNSIPPRKIVGPCCIQSSQQCLELTPTECSATGGIFYGDGLTCGQIDCCFTPIVITYACVDGSCQDAALCSGQCVIFNTLEECIASRCESQGVIGYCCLGGGVCVENTRDECEGNDLRWFSNEIICQGNCE